uniref:Uncharacterized protein n=1 Tax=Triticum urartu TaxID=4572 RepID=A0A8R7QQI9_TRIUA
MNVHLCSNFKEVCFTLLFLQYDLEYMISFSYFPSYKFIGIKVELQVYGSVYHCKVVYGSVYHCRFLTPSNFNVFVFLSIEACSSTIK